jgi:predicted transport protein
MCRNDSVGEKTMSDLKLFRVKSGSASELEGRAAGLEKSLQKLIESNLEPLLGIKFLASEYSTGKKHSGRIDTLGIDENGCPVIIEYKRSLNENVINQGLFYLDWLMDHRAEFQLLVMKQLGNGADDGIDWSGPRLLCIAGDFTRYDEYAVGQMNRSIELIRYKKFGDDLLPLELVSATGGNGGGGAGGGGGGGADPKEMSQIIKETSGPLNDLYEELEAFLTALGDDVQVKVLKHYVAFKRLRNFVTAGIYPKLKSVTLWVKVDPDSIQLEQGFTRDARSIGHRGVGDLEITLRTHEDLTVLALRGKRRVNKAHLLGGATGTGNAAKWNLVCSAVAGPVRNYYSKNDEVLRLLYRADRKLLGTPPIGRNPIRWGPDKLKNHDVSDHVKDHWEFKEAAAKFLAV